MSDVPFWRDRTSGAVWDLCMLDDEFVPGLCEVKITAGRDIDARKAPRADGATQVDKGYELATVDVTCRCWTQEHYDAWRELITRLLNRRATAPRSPFRITHPECDAFQVRRVTFRRVTSLEPTGIGVREAKISFLEFKPPTRRRTGGRVGGASSPSTSSQFSAGLPRFLQFDSVAETQRIGRERAGGNSRAELQERLNEQAAAGLPPSATNTGPNRT